MSQSIHCSTCHKLHGVPSCAHDNWQHPSHMQNALCCNSWFAIHAHMVIYVKAMFSVQTALRNEHGVKGVTPNTLASHWRRHATAVSKMHSGL